MNVILLRRELDIMSSLDHPNIIKLYEIYEDEQYVHLVMEYCSGGDVSERIINDGNFSESNAAVIMEKLLCAVDYLHSHNVSHRDLKAENFLYENEDKNSEIKIADFGMSVKFGNNLRMKSLAGTPYYLAPEVLKGSYTKSCDVWSLGVFLYFILSGSHPFKGFELEEIFEKITAGKVRFEGKNWSEISHHATDLISKMLTVDPRKRVTIQVALGHPWFKSHKSKQTEPVPFYIFNSLKQYKAQSKLFQEALKVMVRNLSSDEISELRKWFITIDKNKSGTITASELEEAMKMSGYSIAEEEMKKILVNIGYLGEGIINYSDFLIATLDKKKLLDEEVLWESFKFFDVDNDGIISITDLLNAFKKAGKEFTENELMTLMAEGKLEKLENIGFDAFKEIMERIKDEHQVINTETKHIGDIVRRITHEFNKLT